MTLIKFLEILEYMEP